MLIWITNCSSCDLHEKSRHGMMRRWPAPHRSSDLTKARPPLMFWQALRVLYTTSSLDLTDPLCATLLFIFSKVIRTRRINTVQGQASHVFFLLGCWIWCVVSAFLAEVFLSVSAAPGSATFCSTSSTRRNTSSQSAPRTARTWCCIPASVRGELQVYVETCNNAPYCQRPVFTSKNCTNMKLCTDKVRILNLPDETIENS